MVIRRTLLFLVPVFLVLAGGTRAETLRLQLPEKNPVVGEMIPVTIRGEYTRRITLETLTFPDSDDYDWMQVARDSWREERVDGRAVKVFERRIALFPRHAGKLTIGPLSHRLTLVAGNGGREVMDVPAETVSIEVLPFPADSAPLTASALKVEDHLSASPGRLRDGETLIRRVTLRADDTLPHLMPPRPVIRQPWLISFTAPEKRETKLTPEGPETTVIWTWHLRPITGEPGVLPPIEFPWFDTVSRQMRTAEIPALPFGYASFAANRAGSEQPPSSLLASAIAVFAAGLVTGLLAIFHSAGLRRGRDILLIMKRLSPIDPTRSAVRTAAGHEDLMALRSAVERYLSRRREVGLPVAGAITEDLDRAIYAPASAAASPFDPHRFLKALLRRRSAEPKNTG